MRLFNITLFFLIIATATKVATAATNPIDDNYNIKAGFSFSRLYQQSALIPSNVAHESHSENTAFGFNTSVGYKWSNWEILAASDALFGKLNDMTFRVDNSEIRGDGSFRIFTLSPLIRYYTPYSLWNRWSVYTSAGPTWSLHTFIISNNHGTTDFDQKKRISFENRGGSLNFGVEEIVPFKETHPAFFEIGYSYMKSHQIFIVDASDFKDVKTLKKGASKDFSGHYFIFRIGITLF
jgi:hypothetical protein